MGQGEAGNKHKSLGSLQVLYNGVDALNKLLPNESESKRCDLAQLSLIYPYNVVNREQAWHILLRIEKTLLKDRGVLRYQGDSYYNSIDVEDRYRTATYYCGAEAEWTFGLPWLALCHMELGTYNQAYEYLKRTEEVMLDNGALPELYYANSDRYNGNCPLGWSNSLFILAKEKFLADVFPVK